MKKQFAFSLMFFFTLTVCILFVNSVFSQSNYNPDEFLPSDDKKTDKKEVEDDSSTYDDEDYEEEKEKTPEELEKERIIQVTEEALANIKYNLIPVAKKYKGISLRVYKDKSFMLQIPNAILFESGHYEISKNNMQIIRDIRKAILDAVNEESYITITLYGHTDTDKRVGDPNYIMVPNTRKNRKKSGLAKYDDKGVEQWYGGKPYRLLPVRKKKYAIVSGDTYEAGEGYRRSLNYNYCLGLDRAYVVHYNLFDTGDVDSDDNFSHYTSIQIIHNSYGFLKPLVSNLPLIYRSKAQEKAGKAKKNKNRRVEIWFKIWDEGINLKIENYLSDLNKLKRKKAIEKRRKRLNY